MATLTIQVVDEDLPGQVSSMSSDQRAAMERQLEGVAKAFVMKGGTVADRVRRAAEIRAMTPKGVKQTDSTELLREDRDR